VEHYVIGLDRDSNNKSEEMIPFLSVASRDFDRDLNILKKILYQFEQQTHSDNAYVFSKRATMAAGWWFYDIFFRPDFVQKIFQLALPPGFPPHDKKGAAIKIVNLFQNQVKLNDSDARIKMYGDIPYATPWWSWLFR
jgi:hypothetical protein